MSGTIARPATTRVLLGPLCVSLAIATLLRALLVLFPPEELSPGGVVPAEELRRGVAAHDIALGASLPLLDYQQTHFSGGTLAISLVAAPIYAVFGPSPIALRAATLPFTWMSIVLVVLLLHRMAGKRAAWIGGLLAACASPGYQLIAATAWGTHVESNAFALLVVWAFARHASGDAPAQRTSFVLGLACGLALSFSYGTALAIALVVLAECSARPRERVVPLARAGGFVIGLVPWLAYNVTHDFAGLGLYGRSAEEHLAPIANVASNAVALVTRHLPASLAFPELVGASGHVLDALVALAFAVLWAIACVLARRCGAVARIALAFPLVFALAYSFGSFQAVEAGEWIHGYRYLALVWPFLWIGAALALDALASLGARALAWSACLTLAGIAAFGTCARARPDRLDENLAAPGTSTVSFARFVVRRRGADLEAMQRVVEQARTRPDADEFFRALGANYRFLLNPASELRPEDAAARNDYEAVNAWLATHVDERWRMHFVPPSAAEVPAAR